MVTDGRTSDVCSVQLTPDFIKNSCRKTPPPTDKAVDRTATPAPTLSFPVSERQAAGSQLTPPVHQYRKHGGDGARLQLSSASLIAQLRAFYCQKRRT